MKNCIKWIVNEYINIGIIAFINTTANNLIILVYKKSRCGLGHMLI